MLYKIVTMSNVGKVETGATVFCRYIFSVWKLELTYGFLPLGVISDDHIRTHPKGYFIYLH